MNKILSLVFRFRIGRINAKISRLDEKYKQLFYKFENQKKELEKFYLSEDDPFSMILLRNFDNIIAELRKLSNSIIELEVNKAKIVRQLER